MEFQVGPYVLSVTVWGGADF